MSATVSELVFNHTAAIIELVIPTILGPGIPMHT